jgi:hypothetical protein
MTSAIRTLGALLAYLSFALFSSAHAEQNWPTTEQFMSSITACATNLHIQLNGDLQGSIKSFYEGTKTQGQLTSESTTHFLELFPEGSRLDAYKIYTNCLLKLTTQGHASNLPPEPDIGWLEPANDPTPDNGCGQQISQQFGKDAVLLVVGNNGVVLQGQNTTFRALILGGCSLVTMHIGANGLAIDADIYNSHGEHVGTITNNGYSVNGDLNLVVQIDLNTLVVHSRNGDELLYVRYANPNVIPLRGLFSCPVPQLRSIVITNTGIILPNRSSYSSECLNDTQGVGYAGFIFN